MSKRFVLLSNQPEDVSFLAEFCGAAHAHFEVFSDPELAVEAISTQVPNGIFIDTDRQTLLQNFEFSAQKRFGLISNQMEAHKFHFIANRPLPENREVIRSPFFGQYFERPSENLQKNAEFYARVMNASEKPLPHGLKDFLGERGETQEVTLIRSDQKQEAAEAVRQYLLQAKVPGRISNIIANSVDELLMNAIFDAPVDEAGKAIYSSTARNQNRELHGREQVKMSIGFDGLTIGVSISDFFGTLDRPKLLNHVSLDYREREYTIRRGQAGAGLGLAAVFASGGSLIYHCETGKKTEATLLYNAYDNFRDFRGQFHFFSARFHA